MHDSDAATIGEVLVWQATHHPDKRVFLFLDRGEREAESYTYAELHRRAVAIAQVLQERDLRGRRVVLAYPSCLEFIGALFGCFYAGAIAVPAPVANYRNSLTRIRTILRDAEAAALMSPRSFMFQEAEGQSGIAALQIPDVLSIVSDEIANSGVCRLQQPEPGELALLQYTSGSTGSPRGVMLTHANLMHNQRVLSLAMKSHEEDIGVSWLPFFHDMGLMGGVLHPVYSGVSSILMAPLSFIQKPMRWLRAIGRYRASISAAPCFAYDLCARQHVPGRDADLDLSSWRVALCGGETVRPRVLEKFADTFRWAGFDPKALLPAYGLTEATLLATSSIAGTGLSLQSSPAGAGRKQLVCCGCAWEGQRVVVVDPESCRRLPPGHSGEIWLQGPSVAAGYWSRSEDTRATFQASLADEADSGYWLRTGDLGFLSPDGLVVTGRCKDIIVIRGANYDPLDIETEACDTHPALSSGASGAFSIEHEGGESVVLAFEIDRGALRSVNVNLLVSEVVSAVNRRFGFTIYDVALLHVGTLPRTTSGKIQRHLCKQLYLSGDLGTFPSIDHPTLGRCRPRAQESA